MTTTADAIVAARVVAIGSESTHEPGMHGVQTRVQLDQVRVLKGNERGATLDLILPGGDLGTQRVRVPGAPEFSPGENVVLFLRASDSADYFLNGYGMGVLRVRGGRVIPDLHVAGGPEAGGESTEKFFARFAATAPAQVAAIVQNAPSPSRVSVSLEIACGMTCLMLVLALFLRRRRRAACLLFTAGALMTAALAGSSRVSAGAMGRDGFTYVLDGPKWDLNTNLPQHVAGGRILWFQGKGSNSLTDDVAFGTITQSFNQWENVPNSAVAFRQAGISADSGSADEGRNVIAFLQKPPRPVFDSNTLAITYLVSDAADVFYSDTDTIFNDRDIPWVATGARYSLDVVSTHEIGHIIGLGHSKNVDDVMYPIAQGVAVLSDSDKAGAAALYPLNSVLPIASAFACPRLGAAPLTVYFSSDGTNPGPAQPLSVQWDFGDGSPPTNEYNPIHVYSAPGTYTATLKLPAAPAVPASEVLIRVLAPAGSPSVKAFQFQDALLGFRHSDKLQLVLDNVDFTTGDSPTVMIGGVSLTASSSPLGLARTTAATVMSPAIRDSISGRLKLNYNAARRELSMSLSAAALGRTFDFRDPGDPAQSGILTEPLAVLLTHADGSVTLYTAPLTFSFVVKSGSTKNGFFEKSIQGKK